MARSTPLSDLLRDLGHDPGRLPPDTRARHDELFRKSIDALFLTQSFRDLSREDQVDPRVQRVMWAAMGDVDDAVLGTADHLDRLSEAQRRAIGDKLRGEPDLALGVFETIDKHAAKTGVDSRRRMQLRSLATQAGWRLRSQPVSLFVDEHLEKVRAVAAQQNRALLEQIATAPAPEHAAVPKKPGETVVTVGAYLLGCSVLTLGLGLVLVSAGGAAVFFGALGITFGVLGTVGGLITLLVGAIIKASA